jgi:hypothetical protein
LQKPKERKQESWSCSPEGIVKINADAAYDSDQGKGGMGAIARDLAEKFIIASCKELHFVADPFMTNSRRML